MSWGIVMVALFGFMQWCTRRIFNQVQFVSYRFTWFKLITLVEPNKAMRFNKTLLRTWDMRNLKQFRGHSHRTATEFLHTQFLHVRQITQSDSKKKIQQSFKFNLDINPTRSCWHWTFVRNTKKWRHFKLSLSHPHKALKLAKRFVQETKTD